MADRLLARHDGLESEVAERTAVTAVMARDQCCWPP
jgi:hypothetical protein